MKKYEVTEYCGGFKNIEIEMLLKDQILLICIPKVNINQENMMSPNSAGFSGRSFYFIKRNAARHSSISGRKCVKI